MDNRTSKCASQHFGPWEIEPKWFSEAVAAVKEGVWQPGDEREGAPHDAANPNVVRDGPDEYAPVLYWLADGMAIVPIVGQMTKGDSSYGGTSSVRVRRAIRKAADDERADAIMLQIDSPGGTVAGTRELADDVESVNQRKPVYAHIDDLGASAAYNVASRARRVTANASGMVGSIGTLMVLEDSSGAYDMAGIKVHVLSTGPHKGAGVPGSKITDEQLAAEQQLVSKLGQQFVDDVNRSRRLSLVLGEGAADGRVFMADDAMRLGLIDAVMSFDQALSETKEQIMSDKTPAEQAAALKETNAALYDHIWTDGKGIGVDEGLETGKEEGKTEGYDDGMKDERGRMQRLSEAFPDRPAFAITQFLAGHSIETANAELAPIIAAEAKAKDEELALLRAQLAAHDAGQTGVEVVIDETPADEAGDTTKPEDIADPKARAEAEWAQMSAEDRKHYISEAVFVAARKRELTK